MNDKFDELAKGLAQSVTRRGALKKFGVGVAGAVLASLGLANKAEAGSFNPCYNKCARDCTKRAHKGSPAWEYCYFLCTQNCPLDDGGA
ncbi:MAG TPA: twin-arginine translocation signal domain-containing protein [Candidatus Binatia bacterium]|nr:twin-arginine translocation signal domain-containing protein [Candidatus Binatia bacterium]